MDLDALASQIVTAVDPSKLPLLLIVLLLMWGAWWLVRQVIRIGSDSGEGSRSMAATLESLERHTTQELSGLKSELREMRRELDRVCRHRG